MHIFIFADTDISSIPETDLPTSNWYLSFKNRKPGEDDHLALVWELLLLLTFSWFLHKKWTKELQTSCKNNVFSRVPDPLKMGSIDCMGGL